VRRVRSPGRDADIKARADVERLAQEQAALRRVATMIAHGSPPEAVFTQVAAAVGPLLGVDTAVVLRFEAGGGATVTGSWGNPRATLSVGDRVTLDGDGGTAPVYQTGVSSSIIVNGQVWGAMAAGTSGSEVMPADAEVRLAEFTELVGTAISNVQARAEVERLADEQAALRRVATLVARECPPEQIFAQVANELGLLLNADAAAVWRYESDGDGTVVGTWGLGDTALQGRRMRLDGDSVSALVYRTGRPARFDGYENAPGAIAAYARSVGLRSAVGAPIYVGGRLWGMIGIANSRAKAIPVNTELRMAEFTELVATGISNVQARAEMKRLADEQAALRRVATLVAEGASPIVILDAVAAEMERLLDADQVALNRFEPDNEMLVFAHRGLDVARTPVGSRVSTEGVSATATVRRTGRPARMENYEGADGFLAALARATGLRSSVSAPITVEGRLWGLITASWKGDASPPADTEERMVRFAQLLETAIANADSRDQLTASRARLLAAGDEARRRVVRDLHDGAQQRLVHTIVTLKLAQRALRLQDPEAPSLVAEALAQAEQGNAELRELAHGILPSTLTSGGLRAGVDAVVARLDLPVQVDVPGERFPAEIEASAYFIVVEALTNVVKHSRASSARVKISDEHGMLHVEVRDNGVGGADQDGHGLVGINDRVTALGGQLNVESCLNRGTRVAATLPVTIG
jgi:signal transduction histidine kinase